MEEALEAEERSNGERAGQGRDGAHGCAADGRLLPAFCTTADLVWWHGAANTRQLASRSGRGQSPQWPQWLLWPPILHVCKCKCSLWMRRMMERARSQRPGAKGWLLSSSWSCSWSATPHRHAHYAASYTIWCRNWGPRQEAGLVKTTLVYRWRLDRPSPPSLAPAITQHWHHRYLQQPLDAAIRKRRLTS